MSGVAVKNSSIHGRGVFAARAFKKGEAVLRWNPRELGAAEYAALPESEQHYVTYTDGKILLMGEPERYVNHSCRANTVPSNQCDVAVRDIAAGEEITGDYTSLLPENFKMPCHCGSPQCRGYIGKKE